MKNVNQIDNLIKEYIKNTYPNYYSSNKVPKWIKECHWKPTFYKKKNSQKTLAIDTIYSGIIPKYQYLSIVNKLLKKHKDFKVIVFTIEERYEENPDIEEFCKQHKIGLKIVIRGIGIQTLVRIDLDPPLQKAKLTKEDGWFPLAILDQAKDLANLSFKKVINDFIDKVKDLNNKENETKKLVLDTIDKLFRYHQSFKSNIRKFMKLDHFETLLKLTTPKASEHIFHSFRVFLAGCPVINEFYPQFVNSHRRFCIMEENKMRVEYTWLLTAIFHDIGRPKEGAQQLIADTLDDEDLAISITGSDTRWTKEHNIAAKRVLGSLGAFVADRKKSLKWDGGIIEDENSYKFTNEWINIYDQMKSHAVISAFDFLANMLNKAKASNERRNRPFIITHAAPASLSILLHDWRIWSEMRKMKLIPINVSMLPMAALLIYIDTWDNYKRKENEQLTYIKEYKVDSDGAIVKVEWGDTELMKKDEIGYIAYKKALQNSFCSLEIKYGLAGCL